MSKIEIVAANTFHATGVRAEPLRKGEIEVNTEAEAMDLEDRGLARCVAADWRPSVPRRLTGKQLQ